MKKIIFCLTLFLIGVSNVKAQIDFSNIGTEHNNALINLNLTPEKLQNINCASILGELKRNISNVPNEIDEKLVKSTSEYLKNITQGETKNSIGISDKLHNSLLTLINQSTNINSRLDSSISKSSIEEFNSIVDSWYITTKNSNDFNSTELAQIDAFQNTAKKSIEFWYGYVNQNGLQQTDPTVLGRRFRLLHWIGVAIMDAGGALIGGAWGPVGSVVLGAAASGVSHALNP
jgi:hypothetical protein